MEKNILRILILVFFSVLTKPGYTQPAEVKWYSFEEAVELNQKEQKKIFIDVYTDWCGWCKKMDANTFSHPTIAKILNEHYYAVKFDAESRDTIDFAGQQFINQGNSNRSPHQLAIALLQGKMSYPSVAYLNENNQRLTAVPGYYTPDKLEPLLLYIAEDVYKSKSFQEFQKDFQSEITTDQQ
ncbi:MAG: DUF255 domain-containing protein [Bacteroidales bacterium]|jgi:thioredoxin-related protein|nr:DUF255 domain-containing protein [Bacteroidales bacterium]